MRTAELAAGLHAAIYVFFLTSSINGLCHHIGYKNFDNTATNIGIIAWFTGGEGYHNNHHAKPRCAAHGLRWWEFDLTRYVIWSLEKCGLAWNVVWPKPDAETAVDPVTADQAGALLLFGAQIKDPRLDAKRDDTDCPQ